MSREEPSAIEPGGPELRRLVVIDRLEVGPVRVEPRRTIAPYRVVRADGSSDQTELSYSYDEDVFAAGDPAALDLARMMAVQPALNYGLFCRQIVLRGAYDPHDRRLIDEMSRNTAREIYVNKILGHNPFLVGDAVGLPLERRSSYLQAQLVYEDGGEAARSGESGAAGRWAVSPRRSAVLSSGGKESLLSYGLLCEVQQRQAAGAGADGAGVDGPPTVTPLFVNESGRHWFTAINAHRHFKQHVPLTARVWTSADRVFNWMLRQIPFVRADFARVRADIYPLRLWTVAVFVFAALPLLRRRGIGRLVIGDEFDTTVRASHHGISHYAGLYDQSRYFDEALSRYFGRKGWVVQQLSILRPLSELLIQKTLVERYPALQQLQVSCHAVHTEGEQMRPCGRCEKCRRVVGMLVALGHDPRRCGYTAEQIDRCLAQLGREDLHQERTGVEHLGWLLAGKRLLAAERIGQVRPRCRPEVLKLRFDDERSPVDGVPVDLRRALYAILLEHADGAVRRAGRGWSDLDLLDEPRLHGPGEGDP